MIHVTVPGAGNTTLDLSYDTKSSAFLAQQIALAIRSLGAPADAGAVDLAGF